MATSSMKPCAKVGCGKLVPRKQRWCPSHHKVTQWEGHQRAKGNTTERGYGHHWRKQRKLAMDRDNWLCQPCLDKGRVTAATECDHITPKSGNGTDDLSNLQAICSQCHRTKTSTRPRASQL